MSTNHCDPNKSKSNEDDRESNWCDVFLYFLNLILLC